MSSGSDVSKSMRRIFSTPMSAATKIGEGIDLLVTMMAWGRKPKLDPASPRTLLEGELGNCAAPAVRSKARHDLSENPFRCQSRPHPVTGTTLPGKAGLEPFS